MATIKAFKAIRPASDKVHLIASRSVDTYSKQELNAELSYNPYSFLHIIKPEFHENIKSKPNSKSLLQKIKATYTKYLNEKLYIADEQAAIYAYQQISDKGTFTGFIACVSADDYTSGKIKIHEQTLSEKEEKLKQYLEICDFNAEPVCFGHDNDADIEHILEQTTQQIATYDFTTNDKLRHRIWPIYEDTFIRKIVNGIHQLGKVYIADGHHRSASSTRLAHWKREQLKPYRGDENFNYFMGIFFSEKQLKIVEFNRMVKDLNGLSSEEFLTALRQTFSIKKIHVDECKPKQVHQITLYINRCWYSLEPLANTYDKDDAVGCLDAQILSDLVLSPILKIHDLRTDTRVQFVPGVKPVYELEMQVDSGKFAAAFLLYPVTMQQLKNVADSGKIMPPKSTWVEPKLRSGLIIYDFEKS
jgi:uncharacterized protein (DUF1015 family)